MDETYRDVKIRKGLNGHPASFRDIMYEDVKSIGSIILGCIIGGRKIPGRNV